MLRADPGNLLISSFFTSFVGECLRAGGVAFFYSVVARRWVEVSNSNAETMTRSEEDDMMIRECVRSPVVAVEVMPAVEEGVGE